MASEGLQIKQQELAEIAELERDIGWRQKRVEELKSNLFPLLKEKVPIEPGRFDARLDTRFRRNVPWKELVINELGEQAAMEYKKQFPVSVYCEIVVVEHAVPPLWKNVSDETSAE